MSSIRPVFIGGCPRSGTTLVRSMLDSHPDLAIPHETRFLVYGYRRRARWGDLALRENREELARCVVDRERSRSWRLSEDPEELVERMVAAPPAIGSVLSAGFRLYAERHGKIRWGDKRPSLLLDLDALFAMFPDAQYVNVVRDPRAVVASIRRVGEAHGWNPERIARGTELWDRSARVARRWRRRLAADQFLEVQYERLVREPRGTLARICAFLDLDPSGIDRMLGFHERTAEVYSEKMHPLIVKPVTTEAVHSWQRELSAGEVGFIEDVLAGPMRRYGYEPVGSGEVPRDLRSRFRARRRRMRLKALRRRRWHLVVRYRYRHPVAAVPEPPQIRTARSPAGRFSSRHRLAAEDMPVIEGTLDGDD
jgi:Sulfotransferase family